MLTLKRNVRRSRCDDEDVTALFHELMSQIRLTVHRVYAMTWSLKHGESYKRPPGYEEGNAETLRCCWRTLFLCTPSLHARGYTLCDGLPRTLGKRSLSILQSLGACSRRRYRKLVLALLPPVAHCIFVLGGANVLETYRKVGVTTLWNIQSGGSCGRAPWRFKSHTYSREGGNASNFTCGRKDARDNGLIWHYKAEHACSDK